MKILSIIPARLNSKGIPLKNIKPIAGKPLIAWNILASQKSKYINRTVVSTDGRLIEDVALKYGAEVIKRPDELSQDDSTSESALLHAVNELSRLENYTPDLVVFLQCTSPMTTSKDIDNCIEKLVTEKADSATTVTDFHYFLWEQKNGEAVGINHDKKVRLRRQDRTPQYIETGAVYVMDTRGFLETKHRFFGKTVLSVMPSERVMEIDDPIDLVIAESMLKKQFEKYNLKLLPKEIKLVIFDFDGVMTDDSVIINEKGSESVICSREDGMGVSMLKENNIKVIVLSTEKNPVVSARCKKLKIECYQNLGQNKLTAMQKFLNANNLNPANSVYMGNDINDVECMQLAGCAIAPGNASDLAKKYADIVLEKTGGKGAVRQLCELIMKKYNNNTD